MLKRVKSINFFTSCLTRSWDVSDLLRSTSEIVADNEWSLTSFGIGIARSGIITVFPSFMFTFSYLRRSDVDAVNWVYLIVVMACG